MSVAADEAIWYSGPESCGGICVSSPPGSEPVPLDPAILETIEDDFISSFDRSPDGRSIAFLELREGPAAEADASMLVKDRALQALDEAVRPGVARLGARVSDPEIVTRRIETALNSLPRSVRTRWSGHPAAS